MRQKNLVIGLLVMLALVVSGFTYAYWIGDAADDTAMGTVAIGSGGDTKVTADVVTPGGLVSLVPATVDSENSVATLTYSVAWTEVLENSASATGILEVTIDKVRSVVDEVHEWTPDGDLYGNMFTIVITYPDDNENAIVVGDDAVTVVVTITFTNEPASQTIYKQVAGGDLEIDLTFAVNVTP